LVKETILLQKPTKYKYKKQTNKQKQINKQSKQKQTNKQNNKTDPYDIIEI
jgi:hypothetical protein